ncbi:hypothetical protein SAMD00023353_1601150 [Rosellinia necatrix]|uniref:Uncharacterized protein n=1 Tax=Rosellinia necatrix TaxID=77044 RepID=A0A1W2TIB6_ROSNE|nr:hypothetical protein SAMD00023353_1601150 [Rosellinia necatrix]
MKSFFLLATLALTASAYRCRYDRFEHYTPAFPLGCTTFEEKYNVGSQTESDACSNVHTNSCYGTHHAQAYDAACRLVVYTGAGCSASANKTILNCASPARIAVAEAHSYQVLCD